MSGLMQMWARSTCSSAPGLAGPSTSGLALVPLEGSNAGIALLSAEIASSMAARGTTAVKAPLFISNALDQIITAAASALVRPDLLQEIDSDTVSRLAAI